MSTPTTPTASRVVAYPAERRCRIVIATETLDAGEWRTRRTFEVHVGDIPGLIADLSASWVEIDRRRNPQRYSDHEEPST